MNQFKVDGRTFTYGQKILAYGKPAMVAGKSEFDYRISYYQLDENGNTSIGFMKTIPAREVMPYNGGACTDINHNQCNHPFHGQHQLMTGFGHFLIVGDQEHYCQYSYSCI